MSWRWKLALGFGALLMGGVLYFALARPVQVLPLMAPVPAFELVDDRGNPFRSYDRVGTVTLYAVGATRDTEGMAHIARLFGDLGGVVAAEPGLGRDLEFAFVTIDGEYDTPERLAAMRPQLDRGQGVPVHLLTGSWVALRLAVGTGFGVYYEPAPEGSGQGPFHYEPTVLVVDWNGVIRSRYDVAAADPAILLRDFKLLRREADAQGAQKWVYAGAHLFLCYPR